MTARRGASALIGFGVLAALAPGCGSDQQTPAPAPAPTAAAGPLVEPVVVLVEVGRFDQPVDVATRPLDTRLYVVEQAGRVIAMDGAGGARTGSGTGSEEVVLDIAERITDAGAEQGLLGLAFHPELDLAYVDFTDTDGDTVVAEFAIDPSTGVFDTASFRQVLTVDQPFANHNGGKLEFGPDGLLYIGLGDGGSADDPMRTALDPTRRLGKILRIDPVADAGEPFTVPGDNPFVGVDGADPTIWAVGLRNPWRFSFDRATGDLWIADVGQNEFEEINRAPAVEGRDAGRGLSFGWSAFEGNTRFNDDQPDAHHTSPVFVYSHSDSRCAVSGGAVARSDSVTDLTGWYVFGDYCSGEIWGLDPVSPSDSHGIVPLGNLAGLAAISAGPDGELFAISNGGTVARFTNP